MRELYPDHPAPSAARPNSRKLNTDLIMSVATGDINAARFALLCGANPQFDAHLSLTMAAYRGLFEFVELLAPLSDLRSAGHTSLLNAVIANDARSARLLLSSAPFLAPCDDHLLAAARHGHADCLRLLISFADPLRFDSKALLEAVIGASLECVELLLPLSDPSANSFQVFSHACENFPSDSPEKLTQRELILSRLLAASPLPLPAARLTERETRPLNARMADMLLAHIESQELSEQLNGPNRPAPHRTRI